MRLRWLFVWVVGTGAAAWLFYSWDWSECQPAGTIFCHQLFPLLAAALCSVMVAAKLYGMSLVWKRIHTH